MQAMYHKVLDRKDKAMPVKERLTLLSEIEPEIAKGLKQMLEFKGDVEHGWFVTVLVRGSCF